MKIDLSLFGIAAIKMEKKAFLLYGGKEELHYGLISELNSSMHTIVKDEEDFLCNFEEIVSGDMFAPLSIKQKTAIIVYEVSEKEFAKYKNIIKKWPDGYILILTGSSIRLSSKFIKFFMTNKSSACCIACYECSYNQSFQILKRRQVTLDQEVLSICADSCRDGSWNNVCEIAKFSNKMLTKDDIENFIKSSTANVQILSWDQNWILSKLHERKNDSISEKMMLLRGWQTQATQAIMIKKHMENGSAPYEAEKKIKPAIFFKNIQAIRGAALSLSLHKLSSILKTLLLAEINLKNPEF